MATETCPVERTLTITDAPTMEALHTWWQARQADPDCTIAFADNAPQHFAALHDRIVTGEYLFSLALDAAGDVVGAMWLHDIQRDPHGRPRAGWVGAYVLPEYRHSGLAALLWQQTRACYEAQGIRSFYAAVHIANTRSQAYATRHMGLHLVGRFRHFTFFGGVLTDCLIYTLHPEDARRAWASASTRAQQQRRLAVHETLLVDIAFSEPYFHMAI